MTDFNDFYKDYYDKTIERKNEINNSMAIPIGIITALITSFFYVLTNFDFRINVYLSCIFAVVVFISLWFFVCSVYYMIKAFSNFHNGYSYAYLDRIDSLNEYDEQLVRYYKFLPDSNVEKANVESSEHITKLLIYCGSVNHSNNERKDFQKYSCQKFMIYSIVSIIILLLIFYVNFVIK